MVLTVIDEVVRLQATCVTSTVCGVFSTQITGEEQEEHDEGETHHGHGDAADTKKHLCLRRTIGGGKMTEKSRGSDPRIAKGILHKSLYFIAIRHRYALFFGFGVVLFCITLTATGIPYWITHQAAMNSVSKSLRNHPLLVLFSHILMLISIYFGLSFWIHSLAQQNSQHEGGPTLHDAKKAALRFVRIVMAACLGLMIVGHFAS